MKDKYFEILKSVEKPIRYIGNEINLSTKKWDNDLLKIALIYPDIYEIGMSNKGLSILYTILNSMDNVICERAFAPWVDFEEKLRENNLLLCSLESFKPLNEFDIIGFTLQTTLNYTNILNILDLSNIPVLKEDRKDSKQLIIAGGPCTVNPEPLSDFIDLFVIGDGEEVIKKIAEIYYKNKDKSRKEILLELAKVDGIYVPEFYTIEYNEDETIKKIEKHYENIPTKVKKVLIRDLDEYSQYVSSYLLPLTITTHDRYAVEAMRGCTRGCRFCSAGFFYRPLREKSIELILNEIEQSIKKLGETKVSLLSLSTSDYSNIVNLLECIYEKYRSENLSCSLPSLRLDNFPIELAEKVSEIRKSGLTFAIEAGSQRLRNVINKNVTEEDLINTIKNVLQRGWKIVKFYFMIGLPTETEEDLKGIKELIIKVINCAKEFNKEININISIATFIPQPHTPFQWERQNTISEIENKIKFLKNELKIKNVKMNWHDIYSSFIEGILARGSRKTGKIIYYAWKNNAKFDQWSEIFNYNAWLKGIELSGVNINFSEKAIDGILPWEIIDIGIKKEFFIREREKAYKAEKTEKCYERDCKLCGICDGNEIKTIRKAPLLMEKRNLVSEKINNNFKERYLYRLKLYKKDKLSLLGYKDYKSIIERIILIKELPIIFTEGFNPHPKIAFGAPLALGYESLSEYIDIYLYKKLDTNFIISELNTILPEGLKVINCKYLEQSISIFNLVDYFIYKIEVFEFDEKKLEKIFNEGFYFEKIKKGTKVEKYFSKDWADLLYLKMGKEIYLRIKVAEDSSTIKPEYILKDLNCVKEIIRITRVEQVKKMNNKLINPLYEEIKEEEICISKF